MSRQTASVPTITVEEAVGGEYVILDVRSPGEFAQGHALGAVNLPLLSDSQRASVGTVYAEEGAAAARLHALDVISGDLPTYLRSLRVAAAAGRRPALMCWRGGERSRNAVLLLSLIGVHALQIEGGYKAYRRWVLDGLDAWAPDRAVVTLFGYTGAGKTDLLRRLGEVGGKEARPYVVDLEGMALHRGSLLGGLYQPGRRTQKQFDAILWDTLRRVEGEYLVVEGEGGKIGHIFLPRTASSLVSDGIPVLVTAPVEQRAERIVAEYRPDLWSPADIARFRSSLRLIGERLPPETTAALSRAFDDGRFYDVVQGLLVEYYDPLYQKSSVEGRGFVLEFTSSEDPAADAARLASLITPLIRDRTAI